MKYLAKITLDGDDVPQDSVLCDSLKEAKTVIAMWADDFRYRFMEFEEGITGPTYRVLGGVKKGNCLS